MIRHLNSYMYIILFMFLSPFFMLHAKDGEIESRPNGNFILSDIKNRNLYFETEEEEIRYYISKARYNWVKNNWQKSLNLYLKARDLSRKLKLIEIEIEIIDDLRKLYFSYGFNNRAIDLSKEMLKYYLDNKKIKNYIDIEISIARFYLTLNDFKICEEYLNDALQKSIDNNYLNGKANVYLLQANLEIIKKNYKKSLQIIEKTYDIFLEHPDYNSELNIALINSISGENKENLGDIDSAEEHYLYALELYIKNDYQSGLFLTYNNLASINKRRNNFKKALEFNKKSLAIALKHNNIEQLKDIYLFIYATYTALSDIKKANTYLEKYWSMKKETEDAEKISSIEKKFEIKKREVNQKRSNIKLSEEKDIKKILILIFLILFGLMCLAFYISLKKKSINELVLKEGKTRAELKSLQSRMNPHFLFNALSSASSLITLRPEYAKKMIINLSNLLRYTLRKAQQNFVYLQEEIDICERYLEMEKIRLGSRLEYCVSMDDSIFNVLIPPLLIQPLVENSVKHGIATLEKGGKIDIICYSNDENLIIKINDNGTGFQENDNNFEKKIYKNKNDGSGIGLSSTRNRLALLYKDEYEFELNNENGVKIKITIPLKIATLASMQ